jgi:hypothetical protein
MARICEVNDQTIHIAVDLDDAIAMIRQAEQHVEKYARDIVTIYEKMPEFDFVHFCFYAYDSAALFEHMLGVDPKRYLSFTLDAPDGFFYTLYGGMAALYRKAKAALPPVITDPSR